jgi:hypothetical protein
MSWIPQFLYIRLTDGGEVSLTPRPTARITDQLIQRSSVVLDKPSVAQLLKDFQIIFIGI